METNKIYDWLLIYFVHEIPIDLKYSNDLLTEVQQTDNGEKNLVVVIRDSYEFINSEYWFTLNVCTLQQNRFIPITDPVLNTNEKRCWEVAFKYIFAHFPSKRKILITYSHGAGFGINHETSVIRRSPTSTRKGCEIEQGTYKIKTVRDQYYFLDRIDKDNLLNQLKLTESEVKEQIQRGYIKKNANEPVCENLELLYIADLAKMLRDNLGSTRLDVLLMVNCYMQLADTCYLLSPQVDYLVAAEGSFSATGYDYSALSNELRQSPEISNTALSVSILKSFENRKIKCGEQDYFNRVTLFANRLEPIAQLLSFFNEYVRYLLSQFQSLFPVLKFVREQKVRETTEDLVAEEPSNLKCIDLNLWMRCICEALPGDLELKTIYCEFQRVLGKIVLPESHIGSVILEKDVADERKFGFSGLSIFYPEDTSSLKQEEVSYCIYFRKKLYFKTDPLFIWKTFLIRYFHTLEESGGH